MRLGSGALKVGGGLERLSHSKEVSMVTPRAGTSLHQLALSQRKFSGNCSPDPILNNAQTQKKRGEGWEPEAAKIHFNTKAQLFEGRLTLTQG